MTVRKIIEIIDFTKSKLGKGEFQTKLQDYQSTIENNSSNIVLLKELLDKSIDDLIDLKNEDIPNLLGKILVGNINPFAIENYKKALSLGYTTSMSSIYQTAGVPFDFSSERLQTLAAFIQDQLKKMN
jgi:hypothetical protein